MWIEIIEFSIKSDVKVFDDCVLLDYLECSCLWVNGRDVLYMRYFRKVFII